LDGTGGGTETTVRYAGFWPRLLAYLLDILPILAGCIFISYTFFEFGEVWRVYRDQPGDVESRIQFLAARNRIRDATFLLWLIYSAVLEASPWQATLGKRLLGIRVVDRDGNRLTVGRRFDAICFFSVTSLHFAKKFLRKKSTDG
jgi:uncharacterized RDD family membrane protein YckC